MLSARNQFKGIIKSVEHGQLMSEVVVKVGDLTVVSLISRHSAHNLNLR
ncbi:MAG TPA: molybdenum-pterin-binding protein, partial [Dehalococcoidia bacterium]|nr:molybdenum-pterin-binding protein [Dehalococcoidia bacterium]